jgi:hypothetical protein
MLRLPIGRQLIRQIVQQQQTKASLAAAKCCWCNNHWSSAGRSWWSPAVGSAVGSADWHVVRGMAKMAKKKKGSGAGNAAAGKNPVDALLETIE